MQNRSVGPIATIESHTAMYTVIGTVHSRAFRVIWLLQELGVPYETRDVKPHDTSVLDHNPSGKIPVLLCDHGALTDSTAIMTYLADKHGAFTYAAGTPDRARQDGLMHQILDEIDAVLWTAARHSFILPPEQRVPEVKASLKWEFARNLDRIMAACKSPYLMGDQMTVPDIILAHCGSWAKAAGFPIENDAFRAYLKTMRARPAFQALMG